MGFRSSNVDHTYDEHTIVQRGRALSEHHIENIFEGLHPQVLLLINHLVNFLGLKVNPRRIQLTQAFEPLNPQTS